MKRPLAALLSPICVALAIAVFLPAAGSAQAGELRNAGAPAVADASAAGAYCVASGGEVNDRAPYFNTNDIEQNWLRLSGSRQFCKFLSKKDGSRIYVELSTLYTETPSLAALAYYAEVAPGSCEGNPASCYCSLLGGSDLFGGINANGGGWVKKSDPNDQTLDACIFPDMSTIDSFGLFYHSAGIIRGANLAKVLRFKNPYGD